MDSEEQASAFSEGTRSIQNIPEAVDKMIYSMLFVWLVQVHSSLKDLDFEK